MAINEDEVEQFISWGIVQPDDISQGQQESRGKELSVIYKFNYQATSSFSVTMNFSFGAGDTGTLSNLVGSILYTSVDTQQTEGGNFDPTLGSSVTQTFPASSFCSVVMTVQGNCDTYEGLLQTYLS